MNQYRRTSALVCLVALLAATISAFGQETKKRKPAPLGEFEIFIEASPVEAATVPGHGDELHFAWQGDPAGGDILVRATTEMGFDGKVVKGAPYSAQAVSESVQTLADGNRIVRKTTTQVYRDSEGRTRREQTLGHVGPFATAGESTQTIFINDPVAGVGYVLIPDAKVARKSPRAFAKITAAEPAVALEAGEKRDIEEKVRRHGRAHAGAVIAAPGERAHVFEKALPEPKKEALGKQSFDGVEAEGTRTTITLAAGEIGNEQPINIVHEVWYSPELQTVVMSRHSDPRFGENTYRLTGINRGEPARALFEVPSDYTIKEGRPERLLMRSRKPGNDEK